MIDELLKEEAKAMIKQHYNNNKMFTSADIKYHLAKKGKKISGHAAGRLLLELKDDGFLKEYSDTRRRKIYQMA